MVLDPDPKGPARACTCTRGEFGRASGIPVRYRGATLETFWDWWKSQHPKDSLIAVLGEVCRLLDHPEGRAGVPEGVRGALDLIVHKCGARVSSGELLYKDLKPAWRPEGYEPLAKWTRPNGDPVDLWWIDGPSGSGRSTLASAVLQAWCAQHGKTGCFVSMRAFGQELKDVYYDVRSFRDVDFRSERDLVAPLLQADCVVLDDLDRLDPDLRVLRSVAQLLDHRYNEALPTLVTASQWVEALTAERFPLLRLEDPSLARRLAQAKRVVLRPTLMRLHERLGGLGG